jgi:chemotaxis protein MotD
MDAPKPNGLAIVAGDAKAAADSADESTKDSSENATGTPTAPTIPTVSMPITAPPALAVPPPDRTAGAGEATVPAVDAVPSTSAAAPAAAPSADASGDADAAKTLAASVLTGSALASDGVKAEVTSNAKIGPLAATAGKVDASASSLKTDGTDDVDSDTDDAGGKTANGAVVATKAPSDGTRPPVAAVMPSDTRHSDSGKADGAMAAPRGDNAVVAAITSTSTVQGGAPTTYTSSAQSNSPANAVPVMGLAAEIASRAIEGKRRFEIRLDPPELGRVDVRLDVSRDGRVTSRLIVERSETLDLLRRDAPNLERALESAGLRTNDSGLQFSLRDQSGNGYQPRFEEPMRPNVLIVPNDDVAVHDAVRRGYGVLRGFSNGIDIRV